MSRFTRTVVPRRSWPRPAPAVTACLVAGLVVTALAGCGPDGGIVLEIHRAPGADTEIQRLELRVGMGHDTGGSRAFDPTWWLSVPVANGKGTVELPDGLGTALFRYKLEAGDTAASDEPLVVVVLGYGADPDSPPLLFGHTSDAGVRFADGEARVIDVPLENFAPGRHGVGRAGCVWWNDGDARAAMTLRQHAIVPDEDSDCDGFKQGHDEMGACQLDCDDLDPEISPAASEVCDDGIDQNCCAFDLDGRADPDGDGANACSNKPDCVDMPRGTVVDVDVFGRPVKSEDIHPGATELCDGIDNDCKDGCDDDPGLDPDGDGYLNCVTENDKKGVHRKPDGRCFASDLDCAPDPGLVRGVPTSEIHPDAADDQCDQIDNDCSGDCDEAKVADGDGDGDGFVACGTVGPPMGDTPVCRLGHASDCDDDDPNGRPGGLERCDGFDFSCDGTLFEGTLPCFRMELQERCVLGSRTCTDGTGAAMPIGPCLPDPTAPNLPLPLSFCAAACSPDDLSTCAGGNEASCDVLFRVPAMSPITSPCPPADIPLVGDAGPVCRWVLVGGQAQGDWKVTLQRGNLSGTDFQGCGLPAVTLRVIAASGSAADRSVLVLSASRFQVVRLRRREVPSCEAVGVECH